MKIEIWIVCVNKFCSNHLTPELVWNFSRYCCNILFYPIGIGGIERNTDHPGWCHPERDARLSRQNLKFLTEFKERFSPLE